METINLLYSTNAFDFRYPHTILTFCASVPTHHLNTISSLHLTCDIWNLVNPDPTLHLSCPLFSSAAWQNKTTLEGVFDIMRGMRGLRVLQIEHRNRERLSLGNGAYEFSRNIDERLRRAVVGLEQVVCLEVKIPWTCGDVRRAGGGLGVYFELQG